MKYDSLMSFFYVCMSESNAETLQQHMMYGADIAAICRGNPGTVERAAIRLEPRGKMTWLKEKYTGYMSCRLQQYNEQR